MKLFFSSLILSLLVMSGCANNPQPAEKHTKPLWTNNGEGAIGVCDSHINGNAAQEQAAMDRAPEQGFGEA